MAVLHLTKDSFDDTIKSGTVLVDFWAAWCGPCRMIAPAIEELGEKYEDEVTVAKVNVDEEEGLAARFGVMTIPTVIVFKDGVEAGKRVGVYPMEELEKMLP